MGHGYLEADLSIASTATRTLSAEPVDLERRKRLVVEALPFEEEDELDWFVSLLVESNASQE